MQIHDVHQSHDRFLCVTGLTFADCPTPHHRLPLPSRSPFLLFFLLFFQRTAAQDDIGRNKVLTALSLIVSLHANILRDVTRPPLESC